MIYVVIITEAILTLLIFSVLPAIATASITLFFCRWIEDKRRQKIQKEYEERIEEHRKRVRELELKQALRLARIQELEEEMYKYPLFYWKELCSK